jgi:hypothetical protein
MRTTLTLDDDVAALLRRVMASQKASLKAVINEALREGLRRIGERQRRSGRPHRTPAVSLGRCLVGNVDAVAEVLAVAEGDAHR